MPGQVLFTAIAVSQRTSNLTFEKDYLQAAEHGGFAVFDTNVDIDGPFVQLKRELTFHIF